MSQLGAGIKPPQTEPVEKWKKMTKLREKQQRNTETSEELIGDAAQEIIECIQMDFNKPLAVA